MSDIKRRDNKGRLLQTGEYQKPDGSYVFRYTDKFGNRKELSSWRLTNADPNPPRKKAKASLREQEKDVMKFLNMGIGSDGITVLELVDKYIATKVNVTHNTKAGYKTVHNVLAKEEFGTRCIERVKYSDALLFLQKLQSDGRSYSSVQSIRGVLRPAFQMALRDELILTNPFSFELADALINDSVKREALSRENEKKFLKFIQEDEHFCRYYDAIYVLFKTGLRISEFCGLTIDDIDLNNKVIHVNHQLQRERNGKYVIVDTKTVAGHRMISYEKLDDELHEHICNLVKNRVKPKTEPMVDGKVGFLFLDKNQNPCVAMHWEKYFEHIRDKYNKLYRVQMPLVTPHVCRHTFATNMAKRGYAATSIQYLMGHSDINVTMNVYTHMDFEGVCEDLDRVNSALKKDKKGKSRKVVSL